MIFLPSRTDGTKNFFWITNQKGILFALLHLLSSDFITNVFFYFRSSRSIYKIHMRRHIIHTKWKYKKFSDLKKKTRSRISTTVETGINRSCTLVQKVCKSSWKGSDLVILSNFILRKYQDFYRESVFTVVIFKLKYRYEAT